MWRLDVKTLLHESWQDVQGLSDRWNSLQQYHLFNFGVVGGLVE
jgi:hypothetical protein